MATQPLEKPAFADLASRYAVVRGQTELICEPLETEDYVVQSMPDVSPTRWHLAHTTWFFETFALARWQRGYQWVSEDYQVLFNSYYNSIGEQFPRARRGLLTRPTVAEVFEYRRLVDERMSRLLAECDDAELALVVELGLHHEQQHQELMLTDVKHVLSCNPLGPVYRERNAIAKSAVPAARWKKFDGGLVEIGYDGTAFCYDNERPRHKVYVEPFELHDRLVTSGEYLQFVRDGGYRRPEFWLSLGWATAQAEGWRSPLYWTERDGTWLEFTLGGIRPLVADEPVCHLSYFEADAFARWSEARLPTEAEWELAACGQSLPSQQDIAFVESGQYHPAAVTSTGDSTGEPLGQLYGQLWQWTQSPYTPYPGYRAPAGALGEYNGKFMCNQYVLRGGSCATPRSHIRPTYRNFFPPEARWQFSGLRLARDAQ